MALMTRRKLNSRRRGKVLRNQPRRSLTVKTRFRRRRPWILPRPRILGPRVCVVSVKMIRGRRKGMVKPGIPPAVLMPEGVPHPWCR
ncbi:polyadenylate binding protein [Sesbania bispinosa]|nr:polyadenylate binding protein [Sesbania bispinosa]